MCSCECTVIDRMTRERMLAMTLGDRIELAVHDITASRQVSNLSMEEYMLSQGNEFVLFDRDEFETLASMMSETADSMKLDIRTAIEDARLTIPDGLRIKVTSRPWNSKDDGGTDHQIILALKKVPVEV
jgi:uncharacterized protein (UPF0216 family)